MSESYHSAYEEIRTLGLTTSAAEKLARLVLSWSAAIAPDKAPLKLHVSLTHEEIAEMIGTSRETVSRVFSDFKKKRLLEVKGSIVTIRDKAGLEQIVQS